MKQSLHTLRIALLAMALVTTTFVAQAENLPDDMICLAYCTCYNEQIPDPNLITHINYAFAELYVTADGQYNGFALQGTEAQFRRVLNLKRANPNIRICVSFTHTVVNVDNRQGGGFSALAANPDSRRKFAADCVAFVQRWGIDGIDLDWEFPGISWSGAACNPANDTFNFTLLLKDLRQALGPDRLLTFAGYVADYARNATDTGYHHIDISAAMPYVDYVNIMTYDLDAAPRFHSSIYHPTSYVDCYRAVSNYAKCGVPYNKLVLGIPFYVRHSFEGQSKSISFNRLATLNDNYDVDQWSDEAQSPYVTHNGSFYGSYDNPRSIAIKGRWVKHLGLKGMFYWDAGSDDSQYTLSRAVWDVIYGLMTANQREKIRASKPID